MVIQYHIHEDNVGAGGGGLFSYKYGENSGEYWSMFSVMYSFGQINDSVLLNKRVPWRLDGDT